MFGASPITEFKESINEASDIQQEVLSLFCCDSSIAANQIHYILLYKIQQHNTKHHQEDLEDKE